jgi:hypothetical protein
VRPASDGEIPELGKTDQEGTIVTLFSGKGEDHGCVGMLMKGAPMILVGDNIYPAVKMTPEQAIDLASELLSFAKHVLPKTCGWAPIMRRLMRKLMNV